MKVKSLRKALLSFIATICLVFVVIISCNKKQDATVAEDPDAAAIKKSREWVATQPKFTTRIVNEKLVAERVDADGKPLGPRSPNANLTASCPYTIDPIPTFENWGATNPSCASDNTYQVAASFMITSENPVVSENPNNSAQKTRGRMIVTVTSTGAAVSGYPNNNILPVTIVDLGPDPTDPTNRRMYRVTYVLTVPSSVFNPLYTYRLGLYFFTDCVDESQYSILSGGVGSTALSPCHIVSPIFPDPYSHVINGVAACACCNPDIMPDEHDVEFSRVGISPIQFTIGIADSYTVPVGVVPRGYTYSIRYRNRVTGTGACYGPWLNTPITMAW